MIRKILLIFIITQLAGIVAFSQNINVKNVELNTIANLGIIYSEYDTINQRIFDLYFVVLKNEFRNNLKDAGIGSIIFVEDTTSFESINNAEIEQICIQHKLDALLISKIYFLRNSFIYKSFFNLKEIEEPSMISGKPDIYMELKIFDSNGELIVWTNYKVQTGSSSMLSPQWTITKGIKKTIKKLKKL